MKKINSIGYVFLLIFCLSNNQLSNEINSETISNIDIRKVNATDGYYQLSYSIEPSYSTAIPSYSLTCSNSGIDPTDYYTVSLDTSNKTCSVTNIAACAYQCELSIYSGDVSASITLDYLKRVTGINAYCYESDDFITFNSLILYGVGTLSSSYSIENESLTFTDEFISLAKSILTPSESNVSIPSIAYYGFDGDQSEYLVSGYEIYDLVYKIYCTYKTVTYSPIGTRQYTSHTIRLSSYIDTDEYKDLFSGHYSLFDYIGYVNGVSYSKSLILQLYQV